MSQQQPNDNNIIRTLRESKAHLPTGPTRVEEKEKPVLTTIAKTPPPAAANTANAVRAKKDFDFVAEYPDKFQDFAASEREKIAEARRRVAEWQDRRRAEMALNLARAGTGMMMMPIEEDTGSGFGVAQEKKTQVDEGYAGQYGASTTTHANGDLSRENAQTGVHGSVYAPCDNRCSTCYPGFGTRSGV